MNITLQRQDGGRQLKWLIDVSAPCETDISMGLTLGSDTGPVQPRIRVRGGRFRLSRHWNNDGTLYKYTLNGAKSGRGYVGTFRMIQDDENTNVDCDSGVLRWHARPTSHTPFISNS